MNDKIDQSIDQATEAAETIPAPVAAEPRKPIVLRRQVVRVMNVQTGLQAGKRCYFISVTF